MISVSPNLMTRSSLEEMLDSLRQRDENDKPKDIPPALPSRPKATSRARLPSLKRSLPSSFEGDNDDHNSKDIRQEERCSKGSRGSSFGNKKVKEIQPGDSPYVKKECEQRVAKGDKSQAANSSHGSKSNLTESECDDNVAYFIKKVRLLLNVPYFCILILPYYKLFSLYHRLMVFVS